MSEKDFCLTLAAHFLSREEVEAMEFYYDHPELEGEEFDRQFELFKAEPRGHA